MTPMFCLGRCLLGVSVALGGFVFAELSPVEGQSGAGGSVSWVSAPKETPNGWYWMYDDASNPPFVEPIISLITSVNFQDITSTGTKIPPYNDTTYSYLLADSFWYYGHWYKPGEKLYISPDGWVSFDPASAPGFPYPPTILPFPVTDLPNSVIAPLWQDNNPVGAGSDNRVYYLYDAKTATLIVEWYRVKGTFSGAEYTYEVQLSMGGQDMLIKEGACGAVWSYHFIHFLYNNASGSWAADGGVTGIENETGEKGITYLGTRANGRVVRAGYKMIFKHDVAAYAFLSPGQMVLRWTPIEPIVVLANVGQEAEHLSAVLDIFDEAGVNVYHQSLGTYDELPNERDTIKAPCWVPGEFNSLYDKRLVVMLDNDQCRYNDTMFMQSLVGCNDTFRYMWNFGDRSKAYSVMEPMHFTTLYPADNGVLVNGGRIYIDNVTGGPADPDFTPPLLEVWRANNGCGLPFVGSPPVTNNYLAAVLTEGFSPTMMGWCTGQFPDPGVWVPSGKPGGIWAGGSARGHYSGWFRAYGMSTWPGKHPCYTGSGPGRGGYVSGTSAYWGHYVAGSHYTLPIELFVHLGFGPFPLSPKPSPPCYSDEPCDLTVFRWEQPDQDYLEAELAFSPKIVIANIGRQTEDSFPAKFIAVYAETGDTVHTDSTLVGSIGWLGDPLDNPDTLIVSIKPWAPEGICRPLADGLPIVEYELVSLVRSGEVGPDLSDHCPYNDTIRRNVESLWKHDVGISDLVIDPPGEGPDRRIPPGTPITITATVENFGFNAEHNVPVRCEVRDHDSGDVLLYSNIQNVSFIDWRGNDMANPYTIDVTFPTYTCANDHWQKFEVRTELTSDMCPEDNSMHYDIPPPDVVEVPTVLPSVFSVEVSGDGTFNGLVVKLGVPHTSRVKLEVFDVNGRLVKTLQNDLCQPGCYKRSWDGSDNAGRKAAAGVYLVRMEAAEFSATRKVVIVN